MLGLGPGWRDGIRRRPRAGSTNRPLSLTSPLPSVRLTASGPPTSRGPQCPGAACRGAARQRAKVPPLVFFQPRHTPLPPSFCPSQLGLDGWGGGHTCGTHYPLPWSEGLSGCKPPPPRSPRASGRINGAGWPRRAPASGCPGRCASAGPGGREDRSQGLRVGGGG